MKLKIAHLLFLFIFLFFLQNIIHVFGASGFLKYPNNPIFSADASSWDSYHVDAPVVIKLNNIYNIWYSANGGSGWRIGYANSINGFSNWTRTTQPVISPGSTDGWENETFDSAVIYDSNNSIYKMWYTSENSAHWQSGADRFRTRYATSTDGINWTKFGWVMSGTPGSWDSGGLFKVDQ